VAVLSRDGPAIAQRTPKRRVQAELREGRSGALAANQVWAMDFAHDQLLDERGQSGGEGFPRDASRGYQGSGV